MGKYTKPDTLSQFAQTCIKTANLMKRISTFDVEGSRGVYEESGMTPFEICQSMCDGVEALSELKKRLADTEAKQFLAEVSECDARECLMDIFGTDKVDSLDEKDKEAIRTFVRGLSKKRGVGYGTHD